MPCGRRQANDRYPCHDLPISVNVAPGIPDRQSVLLQLQPIGWGGCDRCAWLLEFCRATTHINTRSPHMARSPVRLSVEQMPGAHWI